MNEWTVSGEVFYLKELNGEFGASVKVRGVSSRENSTSTQVLEYSFLMEHKIYEDARKRGFKNYRTATFSGHFESWAIKNNRKGSVKVMSICDYVMDIQ